MSNDCEKISQNGNNRDEHSLKGNDSSELSGNENNNSKHSENGNDNDKSSQKENNYSVLSQKEMSFISETEMECSDVVRYFYEGLKIRTFSDVLLNFAHGKNVHEIKELLRAKFCEFEPELKPDSVRKKLDNWFNDRGPDEKITLIKICFALSLNEDDAQLFMKSTQESGFHLRNPEDAAYLYCLRKGKSFRESEDFVKRFPMPSPDVVTDNKTVYTEIVAEGFNKVSNDMEFEQFYRDNLSNFGKLRNTAYEKFERFMNILRTPGDNEAEYTLEETVDAYLRMRLPMDRNTSKYDTIQKAIRALWPNRTDVIGMNNRVEDNSKKIRKILLLLYVVTEGIVDLNLGQEDIYDDVEKFSGHFMEHVVRIDLMLNMCGLARLYPRNPFDWLILYCLRNGYGEEEAIIDKSDPDNSPSGQEHSEGMVKQLQDVLMILFPETPE